MEFGRHTLEVTNTLPSLTILANFVKTLKSRWDKLASMSIRDIANPLTILSGPIRWESFLLIGNRTKIQRVRTSYKGSV